MTTQKSDADQPGAIPVSALHGRASASADAARLAQIRADLALTPRERVKKALDLGAARLEQMSRAGNSTSSNSSPAAPSTSNDCES